MATLRPKSVFISACFMAVGAKLLMRAVRPLIPMLAEARGERWGVFGGAWGLQGSLSGFFAVQTVSCQPVPVQRGRHSSWQAWAALRVEQDETGTRTNKAASARLIVKRELT